MKKSSTKKSLMWIIGIVLVVVIIIGFYVSNQNKEDIKIGTIVFLTGNQQSLGEEINNAFQLAKEDFENKYQTKVDLVIEDSADDPTKAINAYQKLRADGYPIIISTGDTIAEALTPLAVSDKVVLFNTVSASQDVSSNWSFRAYITSSQQGVPLGKFISSNESINKVAILKLNNVFSTSLVNSLKDNLDKDIEIVSEESYNIADTDIRTQLLKIKQANPDILVVTGFGPAYPLIFKQMKELDIKIPIYADGAISIPYFFESAGGYQTLDGVTFITVGFDANYPLTPKTREFVKRYKERYNSVPSFTAAFGYDSFLVVAETLKNCDNKNSEKIRECLVKINNYNGLLGDNLTFSSQNEIAVPLFIKAYTNNDTLVIANVEDI